MSQHSSRGKTWEKTRQRILDRDGWQCQVCNKPLVGTDATVDHIIAKARWLREGREGDPDADSNLLALCRSHNSSKQDRDEMPRINYYNPRWLPQLAQNG